MGVVAILCAGLVLVQGAFSQVDEDTQEQGRQGHQDVIPSVPPVLNKCCPSGQTFDMSSSFSCIPEPQEKHVYSYRETLEPVFLSQKLSERDFFPDAPPFNLRVSGLPRCDPEAGQELTYLINPDNDIEFSNFAVDDEGITGKQYSLFNLDESDIYESYCLETGHVGDQFQGTVAVYCRTRDEVTCQTRPCVSFCCEERMYWDTGVNRCMPDPDGVATLAYLDFVDTDGRKLEQVSYAEMKFFFDRKRSVRESCPSGETVAVAEGQFSLRGDNGKLTVGGGGGTSAVASYAEYCVERFGAIQTPAANVANATSSPSLAVTAVVCKAEVQKGHLIDDVIIPTLFIISLVFLGLLFAYVCLKPKSLHPQASRAARTTLGSTPSAAVYRKPPLSLFNLMTLCLVAMLFLFYLVLIVGKFSPLGAIQNTMPACVAVGILVQFFFLSAHFWLNAMNFKVWKGLRSMRVVEGPGAGADPRTFCGYAAYAWLLPLTMSVVTLSLQLAPDTGIDLAFLPGIEPSSSCLLSERYGKIFYLNVLVVPLLCLNVLFFLLSAWNLVYGVWANKGKHVAVRGQHETRYKIVIKMFFAMGLPWMAEAITYGIGHVYGRDQYRWWTFPFDVVNALQGLILFCVVFFDSKKLSLLREKLCGGGGGGDRNNRRPSNVVTMCTTADSSGGSGEGLGGISGRYSRKLSSKGPHNGERVEMEARRGTVGGGDV